ncbi:maternal B9.10 protein-like [Dendrobates tinctorius]|uniref:maternal B9.10 protein-like n=1 Tax=Dendrobates tinctorius TaxID=92724 RepID=UPI003CCA0339
MRQELLAGVDYVKTVANRFQILDSTTVAIFGENLAAILCKRFTGHWYPENPIKGQAYRCIRINSESRDESILEACALTHIGFQDLALPKEFTLWIDPFDVSCRLGEENFAFTVASFDPRSPRVEDVSIRPEEDQQETPSSCMVDCAIQVPEDIGETWSLSPSSSPTVSEDGDSGIDEAPSPPVEQIQRNTRPDEVRNP